MKNNNILFRSFIFFFLLLFPAAHSYAGAFLSLVQDTVQQIRIMDAYGNDIKTDSAGNVFISTSGGDVYKYSSGGELLARLHFEGVISGITIDEKNCLNLLTDNRASVLNLLSPLTGRKAQRYYVIARCNPKNKVVSRTRLEQRFDIDNMIVKFWTDSSQNTYVLVDGEKIIKKFDRRGKLVAKLGANVAKSCLGADRNIYLVTGGWEAVEREIVKISPSGVPETVVKMSGGAFGLNDMAVDKNGVIYVSGTGFGVKKFDGQQWVALPEAGKYFCTMCSSEYARELAVGSNGNVYVLQKSSPKVKFLDANGSLVKDIILN